MTVYFKKLFSVELQHSYYANHLTTDLTIEVEESSKTILKNSRLVSQILPDKVVIYYESKDAAGTPIVPINRYIPFTFYLRIRNSAFIQRTQLPVYGQNTFYFSNFDLNGNERQPLPMTTTIALHDGAQFTQAIPAETDFSVSTPGLSSVKIERFIPVNGFADTQPIDIHGGVARGNFPQPGLFQLISSAPLAKSLRYVDALVKRNKPFGIIQIWKGADTDYHKPLSYAIQWEKP